MCGYKRDIIGDYFQIPELKLTPGEQRIVDILKEKYPEGFTYEELAEKYGQPDYSPENIATYCKRLNNRNVIYVELKKGERKRNKHTAYFEDYNYISNEEKGFAYPFAPGYVQYDGDFLDYFKKLKLELEEPIADIYSKIVEFLLEAVQHKKHIPQQCNVCRYDHEMRDFIRATLLRLIDGIEEHNEFINVIAPFIQGKEIVTKATHKRPKSELEHTPSKENEQKKIAQKELMKGQQITRPMENEEQTASHETPHKQYKRKPHTEERKRQISEHMKGYFHPQEDIEKMRKYSPDDNAFDEKSADAKYWIGYIMGRGTIKISSDVPNSPSVKISVLIRDRNHLDKFKEFIYPKREAPSVYVNEKKGVCDFEFSSRRIVSKLERYGIRLQKVILLENDKDFWRGLIDANASGKSGKFEISRYGKITLQVKKGQDLILQFKTFAENILGHSIGEPIRVGKKWSLTITDGNAVELYLKLLYEKNSIALDRNLKKIEQILSLPEYKTKTWVRKYFTYIPTNK